MPTVTRVAKKPSSNASKNAEKRERLPPISVGTAMTKKLDKAIVNPDLEQKQLKFTTKLGFVSPSGNPLQVVYLTPAASKTGLDITYVDAKAKQFWAQAPGISGLARGPYKLPAGVDKALAIVTTREQKEAAREEKVKKSGGSDFVFHNTGSENAQLRKSLNDALGGRSYGYGGGSGGGGGGGGWGS
ncbi:MAG: hypothetical protein JNK82_28355 [Myxococcaceae bacterium]|nr:hypothetical protein [Myxococcaceae bacterium]